MVRTTPRRPTRIGRLAAGLIATVVTTAALVGTPVVLSLLARPLVPAYLPRLSAVGAALTHPDSTGRVFAGALLLLGFLAWLTFAISVLLELAARVANRRTWQLPGLGVQQRWAATLITSIALTFASPAAASLAGPLAPATVSTMAGPVALASATPAATRPGPGPAAPLGNATADRGNGVVVYTVSRGDYLGAIAERFEGDFDAYRELAVQNHIRHPGLIHIGDRIELPGDVQDRGVRTHATGRAEGLDAAKPQQQPESHPPTPAKPSAAPTTAAPATTQGATAHPAIAHPTPRHPAPTHPAPTHPATARSATAPQATSTPAVSEPPHSGAPAEHQPPAPQSGDRGGLAGALVRTIDAVAVAGTLAGLIAAGAAAVRHREALQRRWVRHPAATVSAPPPPLPARPAQRLMDPPRRGDLLRLDAALRVLADEIGDWPVEQLPQIMGAYLDHGDVTLMLATETVAPPAPFVTLDSGWWSLPMDAILPGMPPALAPLPSLCTVGGRAEQHVLLDLEYLRVLGIGGDPTESMNLIRYLVADACHNVWSDDLRVCVAGFATAEAEHLRIMDEQRIRVVPSIPDAIDRFSRRFDLGIDTWARPDAAPPNDILFVADPTDDDLNLIADFEQVLQDAPGVGLSVVVRGARPDQLRYYGQVSPAGTLSLDWLGSKTPAASLPAALMTEVNVQLDNHRNSGDKCPLNVSRAASLALRRATAGQPARLAGQHRRPKGVPAQSWSHGVDLMRARHARPATA